jgi:hypothetical protein
MGFRARVSLILWFLAWPAFAQVPGQWQTTEKSKAVISSLSQDHNRGIALKYEDGLLSFMVESRQYLKHRGESVEAMVLFDWGMPKNVELRNLDGRMAVVTKNKARKIMEQLAGAKKVTVRLFTRDDRNCIDYAADDVVLKLPRNTPEVVARVLRGNNPPQ